MVCHYGCGHEAKYQLKNGNWRCEPKHQQCPANRKKYSHPGSKNPMYGKPGALKGKTKENCESLKRVSDKIKEHHKNGNCSSSYFLDYWKGKKHSEETKLKIAKQMRGNTYGKGQGKRTLYNDIIFRSSWEAKVAKHLDDNNIVWKYEEREFILSERESYRPDFFIYVNDSFVKLIEVKGYFREENKKKFQKFKNKYPHIQVELWDKKVLKNKAII